MPADDKQQNDQIDTGGGSYIGESVDTAGDFTGRDKLVGGDEIRDDATKIGSVTHQQGGVTISGRGHRIVGDVVGGNKVNSTVYLASDVSQHSKMRRKEFIADLQRLQAEIVSAAKRNVIDQETSILASVHIKAALSHARKARPDSAKIAQRVHDAKTIISQTPASAGGLVELITGLTRAIEVAHSLL